MKWFCAGLMFMLGIHYSGHSQNIENSDEALKLAGDNKSNREISLGFAEKALELARKEKDSINILESHYLIGSTNFFQGNYDLAKTQYAIYLSTNHKWCDSMRIEDSHFYSGVIYMMNQNWPSAFPHVLKVVDYALASGDHYNLGNAYNMLGNIYANLAPGQMGQSATYHRMALEEFKQRKDTSGIGRTFSFLGENFHNANIIDSAIISYQEAFNWFEQINDSTGQGVTLKNIGYCHLDYDAWDSAVVYINRSMSFLNIANNYANNQSLYAHGFVYLAEAHIMLGEIIKADENLEKYRMLTSAESTSAQHLREYLNIKSMLENAKGNYAQAYQDLKRSAKMKDSLYSEETTAQLLGIMELYQSEAKDRAIAEQEVVISKTTLKAELEEKKRKEADERKSLLMRILISVVVLSVFILLWLRQKRRADKAEKIILGNQLEQEKIAADKLKEEIRFKTQSLTSYSILVAQKNEILQELNEWIAKNKDKIDSASDMTSLIRSGKSFDNEWDEFRVLFDEVHQGYIDRVAKNYSDLSPNEVRLCALLKLNLSSKQMASILNIAPRSVDVSRSRLRKKLNIGSNENLVEYISKL